MKRLLLIVLFIGCCHAQNLQSFTCDKGQAPGAPAGPPLPSGGSSSCTATLDAVPAVPLIFTVTTTGGLTAPATITFPVGTATVTLTGGGSTGSNPSTKSWVFPIAVQVATFVVSRP